MAKKAIREGFHTVTPYLMVHGAERLVDFLKHALDAEETYRSLTKDNRIKHAELRIGDSMIMLAEALDTPRPCHIHLYVADPDAYHRQAIQAGGVSVMEPNDRPIGERLAGVADPSGNVWWMSAPLGS